MDLGIDVELSNKKALKRKEEILVIEQKPVTKKGSDISGQLSIPNLFKTFRDDRDPYKMHLRDEAMLNKLEELRAREESEKKKPERPISPELPIRIDLARPIDPVFPVPPYIYPETKKQKKEKLERRRKAELDRNFCKFDIIQIAEPVETTALDDKIEIPSPGVSESKVKVVPRSPSLSVTEGVPEVPSEKDLQLRKPKSGIIVNPSAPEPINDDVDSFDLLFHRKPRPDWKKTSYHSIRSKSQKSKKSKKADTIKEEDELAAKYQAEQDNIINALMEEANKMHQDGEGASETYLTRMFRQKVEQVSKSTSLNSRDLDEFISYEEEDLEAQPYMTKIIQKFRRDSEAERYKIPPRKVKHGTLESHSFTKLTQKTLKEFYFGLMMGTINQHSEYFPESSRGVQGICMTVAAYCYAMVVHPTTWVEGTIDEIVEVGDQLYHDSVGNLHNHELGKELRYFELNKYCYIGDKKVKFQVFEPEIIGQIRSTDKRIFNLSKGLQLFYQRHRAGIFKTFGLNILIWKDQHFFFFDAIGRTKGFVQDIEGKALLSNFYDVAAIATILLERAKLENWPYTISKISVFTITDKNVMEEEFPESLFKEQSEYNILNENKAVVQGSFDLADLCFDFSRNRQSIAMAAVCLVYSRITPPSAWHKTTIDKIMIIGNQLYLELVESEQVVEMLLDHIPAIFTIGPYLVEIVIYSKIGADIMFRRNVCVLKKNLEKFFLSNSMAIVLIGKCVLTIWKQRGMIYCFDPYSRNNEGLKCRNGTACVTMNSTLSTLIDTIAFNFDDKEDIFYINALKVLKIHRDAAQAHLFPKTMTMDEYNPETFKSCRMKKTNRKAVKTVTANFAETAVRQLLPWNFLDESFIEVGSTVESITRNQMPLMIHRYASRAILRAGIPEAFKPIDLDSPSMSDTQIQPDRLSPIRGEEGIDLDNWELTQEELELEPYGEGEEGEDSGDEIYRESFLVMSQYAQVHTDSLDSYHKKMSAEVNTDITFCFLPVPREILPPTNMHNKQKSLKDRQLRLKQNLLLRENESLRDVPPITKSAELAKETNFIDLPDDTQLIRGTANITDFGKEVDYMAPFVCMMAGTVAKKYALLSWSPEIIDYTLKSGSELYKLSKVRFDQVPILEVPKVSLGKTDYSILSEYLYDTTMKQRILELTLEKILFRKHECGLIVTPSYACTVFFKNHLYYLYDCYGCNAVGLGVGRDKNGVACFARFKTIHDMASRIMYNKLKRDSAEDYDFSRFVLSFIEVKILPKNKPPKKVKGFGGEDGEDEPSESTKKPPKLNRVGYQLNDGIFTIQGSTACEGRAEASPDALKEDHFVSLCASLMLICYPIQKWDTKRVDYVIEQGKHVFSHADNLEIAEKRYIRNILIHKHFFDIIVSKVKFADWNKNKNLDVGLDSVFNKRDLIIIQFSNCSYVVYKNNETFHIFDPYSSKPDGTSDDKDDGCAGWTMFDNIKLAKRRIKSQVLPDNEQYTFYVFEVSSVRRAPKKIVLAQTNMEYDVNKPLRAEPIGRPFNERDSWLKSDIPWSMMKKTVASGKVRHDVDNMWHNWDTEYPHDLYSLVGTIHQTSEQFDVSSRGKQTLANLVSCIAMLKVYDFTEWNSAVLDSILINGNKYFEESVKKIQDEDYELALDDLNKTMTVFPYTAKVVFTPILDGTIFLMRASQYNLFKGLRTFCDQYSKHYGIICVTRGDGLEKRMVAFGKTREHEYFMFDCQAFGPPMFLDKQGFSYILRCRTLKRLVHVLTLTLRGGDFFIFEVNAGALQPVPT